MMAHEDDGTPRLMTVDEVAHFLGVPKKTLYAWRSRKCGPPAHRVGRHLRYQRQYVLAWLEREGTPN
jgi:excisionase family DNA binding protein